jgi:hypothetical protein
LERLASGRGDGAVNVLVNGDNASVSISPAAFGAFLQDVAELEGAKKVIEHKPDLRILPPAAPPASNGEVHNR